MYNDNSTTASKCEFESDLAIAVMDILLSTKGISGHGGYHTAKPDAKNPEPYTHVTYHDIIRVVKNPSAVSKEQAQWAIFSTTGGPYARVHQFQRENGQYFGLWADLDQVEGLTFLDVTNRVKAAIPGFNHIVYTSKSATMDNPKGRVLLPLAAVVSGQEYPMLARILNNRLEVSGLPPDRATERPGQLCYLPNRGEYYQHQIIEGPLLDPYEEFKDEIAAEQARLKEEQQERERRHRAAIQKAQERINTGQVDPVKAFKQTYPVDLALERYGYELVGDKYLSPLSESGKPGVAIISDDRWYSHHGSDAGIGNLDKGGTWGDAFDLFVYFEHEGNFNQAVRAAGEMFTTTDRATGQVISITRANQREYMKQQDSAEPVWEAPIPLDDAHPPAMNPDILTGLLGDMAKAVSAATETPIELAAGVGLSVLAAACQGKIVIEVNPGYREPLNIWVIAALESANRKSSVLSEMTAPLLQWEQNQGGKLAPWIREAASKRQNQEARLKSLRSQYGKAQAEDLPDIARQILDIETNLPEVPVPPKVWAQDVTPEHLGSLMAQHKGRMSILSAEGGIFDIIAGRYSNGVPNLDLFLQGHSGDAVRVDRGSRDPIYLGNPALTLGLSPQPGVLRGLADKPGFRERGLLARCLYFLPGSPLGYRRLNTIPVPESARAGYQDLIFKLLNIEPEEDGFNGDQPHILELTTAAYQAWGEFWQTVEMDLREDGRFEYIRDWAGKLPGAAARLAGLLHCADNPSNPWTVPISKETMTAALSLAAVFADHALIAFDLMGGDPALEGARKVWRWVEKNRFPEFTKRDCFQTLRGTFKKVKMLEEPLGILTERNYLQAKEINSESGKGRKSIRYFINPEITKGWG